MRPPVAEFEDGAQGREGLLLPIFNANNGIEACFIKIPQGPVIPFGNCGLQIVIDLLAVDIPYKREMVSRSPFFESPCLITPAA